MARLSGQIQAAQQLFGSLKAPLKIVEKDYLNLQNKPKINNVELQGNKELDEIGIEEADAMDILNMF